MGSTTHSPSDQPHYSPSSRLCLTHQRRASISSAGILPHLSSSADLRTLQTKSVSLPSLLFIQSIFQLGSAIVIIYQRKIHFVLDKLELSNDIAILYTQKPIQLSNNVNTACLPSCRDQFNHTFDNGTGIRCWVAGWGKDQVNGEFQFIQHKVDLPLVDDDNCTAKLKDALNKQKRGQGNRFSLKSSEICAGGEVGKDACTGDGGSPLVCQAKSGRWTVVGLVTWGVGCASHVPGVYARVSEFQSWIDAN
jgi:secreted trypsin-like serine protease